MNPFLLTVKRVAALVLNIFASLLHAFSQREEVLTPQLLSTILSLECLELFRGYRTFLLIISKTIDFFVRGVSLEKKAEVHGKYFA